jgi:hypothetical protein
MLSICSLFVCSSSEWSSIPYYYICVDSYVYVCLSTLYIVLNERGVYYWTFWGQSITYQCLYHSACHCLVSNMAKSLQFDKWWYRCNLITVSCWHVRSSKLSRLNYSQLVDITIHLGLMYTLPGNLLWIYLGADQVENQAQKRKRNLPTKRLK